MKCNIIPGALLGVISAVIIVFMAQPKSGVAISIIVTASICFWTVLALTIPEEKVQRLFDALFEFFR